MSRFSGLSAGRLLTGGLGLVIVAAVAVAGGYATRTQSTPSLGVAPRATGVDYVRGVVQTVTQDSITLLTDSGAVTLKLSAATPREAVQNATLAAIKPGDWVNAGGVPHNQTLYALTALVVIPAANLEGR
jgi:hypothetical protein